MFGALDEYMKEDYFYEHQKGTLIVGDEEYEITMIAALETLATDEYIFAPTTIEGAEILGHIKEIAKICDSEKMEENKRIVAMSTCKYPDTIDRTVVVGSIMEAEK